MKRLLSLSIFFILLAGSLVVIASTIPVPLAIDSDFRVLYFTNRGLLHGIAVYDHPAKIQMISTLYGVDLNLNFIPQFAYPPWFALSTIFLGWFSIRQAATLWFEINILLIFLSTHLLMEGRRPIHRLLAFPAVFAFLPVLGTLMVGQYDFPVLLGVSLLIHSVRRERPVLTAFAMLLLTFKPHIGALMFVAELFYLLALRNEFSKKTFAAFFWLGAAFVAIGFLADPLWPIHYLNSLLDYSKLGHITSCSECASLPVWLSRWLWNGSLASATLMAALLLIVFVLLTFGVCNRMVHSHERLINYALLTTLVVSPYLYNYDYVLLLVPFAFVSIPSGRKMEGIAAMFSYLAPLAGIGIWGRGGNISLLISTLMVFLLICRQQNWDVGIFKKEASFSHPMN